MKKKYPTDVPRILEIGFFFDGTSNNRENSRQKEKGRRPLFSEAYGSFGNDESNVALLYELYRTGAAPPSPAGSVTRESVYKEGIGTQAGWADVAMGTAEGTGGTGVHARVQGALKTLKTLVGRPDAWDDIVIDVFGFSRGAAAARHFVNCVNAGKVGWTISGGRHFNPVSKIPACRVRFLGVFDTVAAIGYFGNKRDISDKNTDQVNVNLCSQSAEKIVHLVAEHEYRHGFSLNNINGSGGEEITLPGSHSDVGGGYAEGHGTKPTTVAVRVSDAFKRQDQAAKQELFDIRARFANIGWVAEDDARERLKLESSTEQKGTRTKWKVVCTRPDLKPRFNTVAVHIMRDKAVAAGVPLKLFKPGDDRTKIPFDLQGVYEEFEGSGQPLSAEAKRAALRKYGHISAQYDSNPPGAGYIMKPAEGYVRTLHDNDPSKAKSRRKPVGRKQS
jgi:hypothetical protein